MVAYMHFRYSSVSNTASKDYLLLLMFQATIIKTMGYKSIHAQLLSVPPYAVAAVVTVAVGFIADRTQQRGENIFLIGPLGTNDLRVLQHSHVSLRHRWFCNAHR
jgi:hypothetical protein